MGKTTITQLSAETDAAMLREAAELVRRGWRRGAVAADQDGNRVAYDRDDAVCFCAVGAIRRAVMNGLGGERRIIRTHLFDDTSLRLYQYVVEVIPETLPELECRAFKSAHPENIIVDWNDDWAGGQQDVIAVLEKAATLAAVPIPDKKDAVDAR